MRGIDLSNGINGHLRTDLVSHIEKGRSVVYYQNGLLI